MNLINQTFPTLNAELLTKEKVTFPDFAKGELTLMVLVFEKMGKYMKPQLQSNQWLSFWQKDLRYKEVQFFEIPMMSGVYKPLKTWTDNGMRAGIDTNLHGNVACFYGKKLTIASQLGIEDITQCQTFLLDKEGNIIYRASGELTPERREALLAAVHQN